MTHDNVSSVTICLYSKGMQKTLTGRNPKFFGLQNPTKCEGYFTFPVHSMNTLYNRIQRPSLRGVADKSVDLFMKNWCMGMVELV